jgi:transposase
MNLTVTNILKRVLPIKGFCYRWARWVRDAGVDGPAVIEVGLAARQGAKAHCGRCGRASPGYDHSETARCWQFISLWAIQVCFLYAPRRVQCQRCGVRVERLPWASGKLQVCDAFRIFLAQWARLLSWQEVANRFQVKWSDVYGAVKSVVRYGLRHRSERDQGVGGG